jgi:hypothetical protein
VPNLESDRFTLTAQLMVPKPQNLDSFLSEKAISLFISGPLVRKSVSSAIKLHGQVRKCAQEIEIVRAEWVLTTEFEIGKATVAQ